MGRYIAVSILTDIKFQDEIGKEIVTNAFPESIFDYSEWDEERFISIKDDYPGSEIAKLRKTVYGFIDESGEPSSNSDSKDEPSGEERINQLLMSSSMSEIREALDNRTYETFQKSYSKGYIYLEDKHYRAVFDCIIISIIHQKFYPKINYHTHEIIEKLDMLLHKLLSGRPQKEMVKCIITL